ncbi:cell wall surface anchor protein [Enterococcus faecalis]|nr:cell wall surface anchor protein [Enterococcus faecalis]OSH14990.1 cell wall surface anchor protein [Enterococcus faecalis]OSH20637.1 cell wall surface anchor protein [Enterococcus faecalis]OSH31436.1 cell wall surface anchor protein [Enterococcus faecalis]OSH37034.1 cell wall surface anchor protein [Enterococcus faecalis]
MILSFYFFAFGIETSAAELRFSVETEIPENQIDKTKTYFDLMMKPDQEQILKVRAANSTDENLVIDVSVKSATTNSNGVIEYGESLTALDKSAPADLSEIIQLKDGGESVELPAKSEKVDETKDKQKENTNGLAIENRYAYTVAVLLRENETVVQPELSLEKVEPTQRNARSVISATLLNHEAAYLQSMKVTANVKNKKTNNVILEKEQEDMQMALNSIFNFPIPYEENEMEAGTYVLAMTVEGSGKKWQFTKEFTISKEEAKTFNEKDVTVKKTESKLIYLLIGLLLLLLIICLFIILRLKKQKNK